MEEHELLIVDWINELLGHPIALLLGLQVAEGEHAIPMHVIMTTFVLLACFVFFGYLRSHLSVENPGKLQQVLEVVIEFVGSQLEEIVGHGGRRFLNIIGTLGVFILFSNMLGLVPGMAAPTSNINVPAGCAIIVFLYYNIQGIRQQASRIPRVAPSWMPARIGRLFAWINAWTRGVLKYMKHFMGPVWWLAPLMIPIEIISHIARPFSLTVRLFANIFAEELLIVVFFGLVPFLLPLPFMAYAIFGGILQAFIFITLTMVYLGGAVATDEH